MNWQPIETAPKDGEQFLCHDHMGFIVVAHYSMGDLIVSWDGEEFTGPTHWMPLPEPPTTDKED